MVSREILNSHPISVLRKEVSKFNKSLGSIKSTQKKPDLVNDMMKHPDAFSHIKMATKKERSEKQKANDAKLGAKQKAKAKPKVDKGPKKPRSEKQKANDAKLGAAARARAAAKKSK